MYRHRYTISNRNGYLKLIVHSHNVSAENISSARMRPVHYCWTFNRSSSSRDSGSSCSSSSTRSRKRRGRRRWSAAVYVCHLNFHFFNWLLIKIWRHQLAMGHKNSLGEIQCHTQRHVDAILKFQHTADLAALKAGGVAQSSQRAAVNRKSSFMVPIFTFHCTPSARVFFLTVGSGLYCRIQAAGVWSEARLKSYRHGTSRLFPTTKDISLTSCAG